MLLCAVTHTTGGRQVFEFSPKSVIWSCVFRTVSWSGLIHERNQVGRGGVGCCAFQCRIVLLSLVIFCGVVPCCIVPCHVALPLLCLVVLCRALEQHTAPNYTAQNEEMESGKTRNKG